jgi:WD40 repeat protein
MLLNFSENKKHFLTALKLSFVALSSLLFLQACTPSAEKPLQRFQHSIEASYAGDISNDGKWSVISSINHGISVWDIEKNALTYQWSQQQNSSDNLVLAIDISNNNSHALTASRENFALWNMKTGKSEGYWKIREASIRDIAVSNNGDYLLIGKGNGTVVHVAVDTGRRLEFLGHTEKINSVDMMPNGRVAMSGGNDFIAYVWDTTSGQVIYQFNHTSRVSKVSLDPQGRFAFSADSMKSAHVWDLKTGKLISKLKGTKRHEVFSSLRFSPDGKTLVTGAASSKVSVWDIASGKRTASWHVTPKEAKRPTGAVVYSLAFSDNDTLLTESSSGYAELWQLPNEAN